MIYINILIYFSDIEWNVKSLFANFNFQYNLPKNYPWKYFLKINEIINFDFASKCIQFPIQFQNHRINIFSHSICFNKQLWANGNSKWLYIPRSFQFNSLWRTNIVLRLIEGNNKNLLTIFSKNIGNWHNKTISF